MARSEARIAVTIWDDRDFRALPSGAQWLYMFLVSQPDIALTGLLALRERRWAARAADMKPETVAGHLQNLAAARFVVVDEETEEVLVRSLLRRDEVYRQPNLLRAAEKQLPLIASPKLRAALATEMHRILDSCDMPAGSKVIAERMLTALSDPSPEPFDEPIAEPFDEPNDDGSLGTGEVVTVVPQGGFPRSPSSQDPIPPSAGTLALVPREPAPNPQTAQELIGEWIDHCRKRPPNTVIGQTGKQIKAMLGEGIDPADVRAGLAEWWRKGLHPSALPSVVNELMNAAPARASPRPGNDIDWQAAMRRAQAREAAQ